MFGHRGFTSLLVAAAIGGLSIASAGENPPPMATPEEASSSFRDVPALEKSYISTAPSDRNDGLDVGELDLAKDDYAAIKTLAKEIAEGQHGRLDSLLIAHKDKLVLESYFLRGRIDLPHPQASATKAYTSMAIGRAIQLGHLSMEDLDKPVVSFLTDLDPSKFVDGAEHITLHMAMTMRSGIRIDEDQQEDLMEASDAIQGQRLMQTFLERSAPISTTTQDHLYQGMDPQIAMMVLDAVVPGTAEEFIKSELLDKMGMTNYRWLTDVNGLPMAGWQTSTTSRDMLKWGRLAANDGKWNGEQLIPAAYIEKATNRVFTKGVEDIFYVDTNVKNAGYGYFWWQADLTSGDNTYFSTSAQGGGGQHIILVEDLDLIVVITAHERETNMMQLMAEKILPAFEK